MQNSDFEFLIDALKSLPGIGKKQAQKIGYFLVNKDQKYIDEFVNRLLNTRNKIKICKICNNYSSNEICEICSNDSRNNNQLCIVSSIEDLKKIEDTNSYTGKYYVLNGEIDIKKKIYLDTKIVQKFMELLKKENIKEIIIATNWTVNGEATAAFIKKIIDNTIKIEIYRIALGLPINSALDYADNLTLKYALKNKTIY